MDKLTLVVRVLFGLIFFVFGLNYFFNFFPKTPPLQGPAEEYISVLMKSPYFFPLLKVCEVVCGLAILSGYFVPLALVIITPVVVQIFLFHIFLAPPVGLGVFLFVSNAYLGWAYRDYFAGLFKA